MNVEILLSQNHLFCFAFYHCSLSSHLNIVLQLVAVSRWTEPLPWWNPFSVLQSIASRAHLDSQCAYSIPGTIFWCHALYRSLCVERLSFCRKKDGSGTICDSVSFLHINVYICDVDYDNKETHSTRSEVNGAYTEVRSTGITTAHYSMTPVYAYVILWKTTWRQVGTQICRHIIHFILCSHKWKREKTHSLLYSGKSHTAQIIYIWPLYRHLA